MHDDLLLFHSLVVKNVKLDKKRFIYEKINWDARAICIAGARGTGKTTLLLQFSIEKYNDPSKCLYISGDHIHVVSAGLLNIAKDFFAYGGQCLIVDEVHKYPNWSQEIKNIYDIYTDKQIIISGSSTIDLTKARFDLSRRVVYHHLPTLSFREYLEFAHGFLIQPIQLCELIANHTKISTNLLSFGPILQYFEAYLKYGSYPYFLEGKEDYYNKVTGAIEKVLFEDIAIAYNLPQAKIPVIKKILWMIATTHPFVVNVDGMARDIGVSRPSIYNYLETLETAALLRVVKESVKGAKIARKFGKLYFENSNLLYAIARSIKNEAEKGTIRESFFAGQLSYSHKLSLHKKADFMVDDQFVFEIGGPSKKKKQIAGIDHSYLAVDGLEMSSGTRIPLYLFGFLY